MGKTVIAVRPMIYKEARECVDDINTNMNSFRALILDLYEREGWLALGYQSWRECVTAEFKSGQSYLYRQLEAAKAERAISPLGEKGQIPERQLRPLTQLEPDQQVEAWEEAVETAPNGKVTAAHVARVVEKVVTEPNQPDAWITSPVSDVKDYIKFAISQLERISDNDPEAWTELGKLILWIEKRRRELCLRQN